MLNFLKAKWTVIGLEAPIISWIIVATLLLGTIVYWLWLFRIFLGLRNTLVTANQRLAQTRSRYPEEKRGLSPAAYEDVNQDLAKENALNTHWQDFSQTLICRSDERTQQDYFWRSESAANSFNEAALLNSRLNLSLCQSLPGIITGIGLLFTFIAILIALLDVKLVNNRVQGIELLIQGLSGKFISSIVALFLATIHLFIEKSFFNWLRKQIDTFTTSLDRLFPLLTNAQLMEEMRAQIAKQTDSIRNFSSDLAPVLKASINEGVGPMLNQMATSIEGLNQLLRQSEAQKQESITGSIETLLQALQTSLTESIDQMSRSFTQTLSTNAQTQFSQVIQSLSDTTTLLNGMNAQFANTQKGMAELIDLAKMSTHEQFRQGRQQIESLTAELGKLLAQMTQQLESNAATTTGTAQEIIAQANSWSKHNSGQIEQMMEAYKQQFASAEELRQAFAASLVSFTEAISKQGAVMSEMRQITTQFSAIASSVKDATKETQATQQSLQQVAARTETQAKHLAQANARQAEMWSELQTNLDQYKNTFEQVGKAAGNLLNQINEHLKDYMDTTHRSFQELVKQADEKLGNAAGRLGGSVDELGEKLDDLTEILGRIPQNGHR
jgi:methyl-accepting chemotaxis protein